MFFYMFFHFFRYHIDESVATNFSCYSDDLLYFTVDPWEAFEIMDGFTPQILPALFTVSGFQSSIAASMSYCISNCEGFPAVHDLKVRVGSNGCSNHLEDLASVWGFDTPTYALVEWLKQWGRVWWQKYHLNIFILDADGLRMARRTVYYQ